MTTVKTIFDKKPNIEKALYIAEGNFIAGDVVLEDGVNIWANCSFRGDLASIRIGKNTNIQENSVIHTSYAPKEFKEGDENIGHTIIGENNVIGHAVILHSCKIGNNCLVGMGSIVMDEAVMEDGSMLAAGSLLAPRKVVKSGELWAGSPARFFRKLTEEDLNAIKDGCNEYLHLAEEYKK